jgi:hypothetical protein
MSWTPTRNMSPTFSPPPPWPKSMAYDEFIAWNRGLLKHPAKLISRHCLTATPGVDASAIHGRLGARVALLQSPILSPAVSPYSNKDIFRNPVDKPHTCISWFAMHGADTRTRSLSANLASRLISELCETHVRPPPDQYQTAPGPTPDHPGNAEGRMQNEEARGQRSDDRRQTTDHGRQRAEDRGQKMAAGARAKPVKATIRPPQSLLIAN